jgi:AraC-like DNA-binding protein
LCVRCGTWLTTQFNPVKTSKCRCSCWPIRQPPVLRLVSSAYMPSPLSRQVRWSLFARPSPSSAAFPVKKSGRLLQLLFRDLLGVYSRYGLHLAESPCDPFHRKLRQLRCLRRRFDCYRVERTSSRAGVAPARVQRLFTAHYFANHDLGVRVGGLLRTIRKPFFAFDYSGASSSVGFSLFRGPAS